MNNLRCQKCGKVLAKTNEGLKGGIEIKCQECKSINSFLLTDGNVLVSIKTEELKAPPPKLG